MSNGKAGGGATGLMHPGSSEYSMLNQNMVNKFLDEGERDLAELFDR
jgi:hypothetical protein